MFICTANVLHTIPQALRDRMEVLQLAGYTEQEKVEIAKKFLVPKAVEGAGLTEANIRFTTRRCRRSSIATRVKPASETSNARSRRSAARSPARSSWRATAFSEEMDTAKITEYLGVPRYRSTEAEQENEIGIATGLAWTEVGGEILVTEATLMPGKGSLMLTGKLGDVMQESARAAMSWVRSKADEFGLAKDWNRKHDVHIHVPEGAIPKDGPSAGITIATALVSALARVPTQRDVAMTGEITLRGKVLPIGGRQGKGPRRTPCRPQDHRDLPKDNEKDLADIPKAVLDVLSVYMVQTMDDVLKIALADAAARADARRWRKASTWTRPTTRSLTRRSERIGHRGSGRRDSRATFVTSAAGPERVSGRRPGGTGVGGPVQRGQVHGGQPTAARRAWRARARRPARPAR